MSVRIRMYRQGLGDCFLLSFGEKFTDFHMLIDCGVLVGTEDAAKKINRVVENIHKVTEGHLDIVVASHEHWDHLSGFVQAKEEFDKIDMDEVWLAWTEDPTNPVAGEVRKARDEGFRALTGLQKNKAFASRALKEPINQLLSFFGPNLSGSAQGPSKRGTEAALAYLKGKNDAIVRYLTPGMSLERDPIPGVRFYILGPPVDGTLLRRSRPRKGEVYERSELTFASSFLDAVEGHSRQMMGVDGSVERGMLQPFDERYDVPKVKAEKDAFFTKHYFGPIENNDKEFDRTIEIDWAGSASDIALKLDAHTNNTSLVVAVEFSAVPDQPVLLFPADAQAGNWLSWKNVRFSVSEANHKRIVKGPDLLRRTVFYKVGHHGSHNATMSKMGLDLMSDDLIAAIPVDRKTASKMDWDMPFPPLLKHLEKKCKGRVVLADESFNTRSNSFLNLSGQKRFSNKVNEDQDYIDFTFQF